MEGPPSRHGGHKSAQFSCFPCRSSKLRCDRQSPCGRCTSLAQECKYPKSRRRPGQYAKRPRTKDLETRLVDLEHRYKTSSLESSSADSHSPPSLGLTQTGRHEWVPPESVTEDLNKLYFSALYHDAPMQHPGRYLASLHRPSHMQPPLCLQYAILALAADISPQYKALALPFYQRARNYIQFDEMQGDGQAVLTLGHAQCWVLLASFESVQLWYTRASLSISRSIRLAQMLGIFDVEGGSTRGASLAPPRDWIEREERRRTMWAIFCSDRAASHATGWAALVDHAQIKSKLPASERGFHSGVSEDSVSLSDVLKGASSNLSTHACRALAAHLFHDSVQHTFGDYPPDDPADIGESTFWKRHNALDSSISAAFISLPDHLRSSCNADDDSCTFTNLRLHSANICVTRTAVIRAARSNIRVPLLDSAASSLLPSAQAIFQMTTGSKGSRALAGKDPLAAFSCFIAGLIFLEDFAASHKRHSEECLGSLMALLLTMSQQNPSWASMALRLARLLQRSGIDATAVEKVQALINGREEMMPATGRPDPKMEDQEPCPFTRMIAWEWADLI